ncbi:MAG: DNA-binding MarR family transcriptional regulator [Oceanospirillaceae bacterium]|jgi:DNA-binding MarR family transcriptional regulator
MIDLNKTQQMHEAIRLFYFSYRVFTERADQLLDKRGLNRAHHRILYFVDQNSEGSVGDLLKTLAISKQALNTPLRQLISMGLVETSQNKKDKRIKILRLTESGSHLNSMLTATQFELLNSVFESAEPEAENGWKEIMQLIANLEK